MSFIFLSDYFSLNWYIFPWEQHILTFYFIYILISVTVSFGLCLYLHQFHLCNDIEFFFRMVNSPFFPSLIHYNLLIFPVFLFSYYEDNVITNKIDVDKLILLLYFKQKIIHFITHKFDMYFFSGKSQWNLYTLIDILHIFHLFFT